MKMSTIVAIAAALLPLAWAPYAHSNHAPGHAVEASAQAPFVAGEVKKVDKEAGKITLKHEAIPNLDMTPMTMVFRVKDAAMLDAVKAGDKVRFKADKVQGAITVTEIDHAK